MTLRNDREYKVIFGTNWRYDMIEMHLFDNDAREEEALCGVDTSADDRRGVNGYLEARLLELSGGTVCEGCKALVIPFAENLIRELEANGRVDEAEDYRQLAYTLSRETGSLTHICGLFCVSETAVGGRFTGTHHLPYSVNR